MYVFYDLSQDLSQGIALALKAWLNSKGEKKERGMVMQNDMDIPIELVGKVTLGPVG